MKTFKISLLITFSLALGFIVYGSFKKNLRNDYSTVNLQQRDIRESIFIPGNIYPAREIEVKSQISGILEEITAQIGNCVREGTPIARIKLIPNTADIERLENSINMAQIEFDAQEREYKRMKTIYENKLISESDMDIATKIFLNAKENLYSAKNQLELLQEGRIASKNISNIVTASTSGTIIDIPIEVGASVIERNNYNPGTTIAVVAEIKLFKFRALVPEQYLKNISLNDSVELSFNAYPDLSVKAFISKISSKGNPENGIMKYMMEAEFFITPDIPMLRSGYSVTAEIVLNKRKGVYSIEEKYLSYQNDSVYLYTLDKSGKMGKKKRVIIGISDGTNTEIIEGVSTDEHIITNYEIKE